MIEGSGFFRFGGAYPVDRMTVRLRAVQAVGDVQSFNGVASINLWLAGDSRPVMVGYGDKSNADNDRAALMTALLQN